MIALAREYLTGKRGLTVAIIVVMQVVQTLASLALPSLNARIIDDGISRGDIGVIWRLSVVMVVLSLAQAVCAGAAIYLAARIAMGQGRWLRERLFRHVQRFATPDMRAFGAPSLITRCTNDVQHIQMVTFLILEVMVVAPLMGVGGVILAIHEDVALSGLLLIVVPILAASVGAIMMALAPRFRAQQEALDSVSDSMRAQLGGARVIRAFRRQQTERRRYEDANAQLRRVALGIGYLFALLFPLIQVIVAAAQIGVMEVGARRVAAGAMQVGALTAFITYLILILMAVLMASFVFTMIPRAQVCAGRVRDVMRHAPTVTSSEAPRPLPARGGVWRFEGVEVRVGDAEAPVLWPFNLEIRPGETTAIIGSTGSGKTTLVSLLPRLRDPQVGRVTVGGVDVRDLDLAQLRTRIAYVPQRAYLFSGTVAETVCGAEAIDTDRLVKALGAAQAREFVDRLDGGIEARVEAGGVNLSGGQRQRLQIARALYRDADLYVFDDAFSALDYATDARVRAGLRDHVGPEAAVVIVAQRVASIRHATQIVVLEHGQIVGRGTHDELIEACPVYREIAASQNQEATA